MKRVKKTEWKIGDRAYCECGKFFLMKSWNSENCSPKCKKISRAKYCSGRWANLTSKVKKKLQKKNSLRTRKWQRDNVDATREHGALYRMYGTLKKISKAQRIKCAKKRMKEYPEHFSDKTIIAVKGGDTRLAYQPRVRSLSQRQKTSMAKYWFKY